MTPAILHVDSIIGDDLEGDGSRDFPFESVARAEMLNPRAEIFYNGRLDRTRTPARARPRPQPALAHRHRSRARLLRRDDGALTRSRHRLLPRRRRRRRHRSIERAPMSPHVQSAEWALAVANRRRGRDHARTPTPAARPTDRGPARAGPDRAPGTVHRRRLGPGCRDAMSASTGTRESRYWRYGHRRTTPLTHRSAGRRQAVYPACPTPTATACRLLRGADDRGDLGIRSHIEANYDPADTVIHLGFV